MQKKLKLLFLLTALGVLIVQVSLLLKDNNFGILSPKGLIASQQKDLIIFTVMLSLVVVVPVFIMVFLFAHKYNEKNTGAKYTPDWDNNKVLETIWWGVPILLIFILSVVTFKSSHDLDPFKHINAGAKPLKVQVVALQWKWLFIYPEYDVASLNYLKIPTDRPLEFEITSDAPMNSFWIPQLGGQIYAMSGMSTQLNLLADKPGEYRGSSANLSGKGFAGMNFMVSAVSDMDFVQWAQDLSDGTNHKDLTKAEYEELAKPSENSPVGFYHVHEPKMYHDTVMKYMQPANDENSSEHGLMIKNYNEAH